MPTEAAPAFKLPEAPAQTVPSRKNYVWNFVDVSTSSKFSNQGHDEFKQKTSQQIPKEKTRLYRRELEAREAGKLDLFRDKFARLPIENPNATLEDAPKKTVPHSGLYRRLVRQTTVKPSMSPDGQTEVIQGPKLVVQEPSWKARYDQGYIWSPGMGKKLKRAEIIPSIGRERDSWKIRNVNPLLGTQGETGTKRLPIGRYVSRSEQSALTR